MENLRELRKTHKKTQQQMANLLGISQQAYATYENDKAQPPKDVLLFLANYFKVSVDYLIENTNSILPQDLFPIKTKKVPLIGTIACGTPILAAENIEDYIDMDESVHADYCLRCKGDSMINARIFDGDIVYIKQQEDVENGEIAAVIIDGETTLKRVYKYEHRIELRAENPTFMTINIEGDALKTFQIIGKAVAFLSIVR